MIEPFMQALSELVVWLALTSLKALPLIAAIIALRKFLAHNLSTTARYCLWMATLFCLITPLGWQVDWRIARPVEVNAHQAPSATKDAVKSTTAHRPTPVASQLPPAENLATEPPQADVISQYGLPAISLLWLAAVICLGTVVLSNLKDYYIFKRRAGPPGARLLQLLAAGKARLKLDCEVRIRRSADINTPVMVGWLSPALLVPYHIEEQLSDKELNFILLHELAHIKRRDILFNWMVTAVQVLHWFNPLVWLASRLMRADMEAACDALVLRHLPDSDRRRYGNTLIRLSDFLPPTPSAAPVMGILETHSELVERLKMIGKFKHLNLKTAILAGIILSAAGVLSVIQPANGASEKVQSAVNATDASELITLGQLVNSMGMRFGDKILIGADHTQAAIAVNQDFGTITYSDFLSLLKINGYTSYKDNDSIQVIPLEDIRSAPIPVMQEGVTYPDDQFVTALLKMEKACALKRLPIIRPMVAPYNVAAADGGSNALLVTDTYSNVLRLKDLIRQIDAQYDEKEPCRLERPRTARKKTQGS
ncbi:M48 family metalloprotease [Exilibacterium tricleocarpae]|uniref:M48 family metalloprotease n=1 Tax=Exilibacterium tricleocarpae TaxID=2591008 RepID=A0A545TZ55_9GAMM|nr:M56 family metallopeptidase [Exilibacterium tricleocarpae]TQV82495.1 M48 family metalloprotease [Exilibacterium tricleocarpae]